MSAGPRTRTGKATARGPRALAAAGLPVLVALAVALSTLTACTSASRTPAASAASKAATATASATVLAGAGGALHASVPGGGASVSVPAVDTAAGARLSLTSAPPAALHAGGPLPDWLEDTGSYVHVDMSAAGRPVHALTAPATVTFGVDAPFAAAIAAGDQLPVVVWDDTDSTGQVTGRRLLPATFTPAAGAPAATVPAGAAGVVTATTDHFSGGFLGRIDVKKFAANAAHSFANYITGRSGVDQPHCGDENAARGDGVTVTSDGGDRVKWCYGIDQGQRLLKVANNTRALMQISYPSSWKVVRTTLPSVSVEALVRRVANAVPTPAGTSSRIVDGGDTLVLAPPAGAAPSGGLVTAEVSVTAWALTGALFGVEVYGSVVKAVASPLASRARGKLDRATLLGGLSAEEDTNEALHKCIEGVSDMTGGHLDAPVGDNAKGLLKFMWKCVPQIASSQLKDVRMWALGSILKVIGSAVGLVLTAANLLVTGVREIWDGLASFGGRSRPVYRILVSVPALGPRALGWQGYRGVHIGETLTAAAHTLGGAVAGDGCSTYTSVNYGGPVWVDDGARRDGIVHELYLADDGQNDYSTWPPGPFGLRIGMSAAEAARALTPARPVGHDTIDANGSADYYSGAGSLVLFVRYWNGTVNQLGVTSDLALARTTATAQGDC